MRERDTQREEEDRVGEERERTDRERKDREKGEGGENVHEREQLVLL